MPNEYDDINAECPFYDHVDKNKIICEAILADAKFTISPFSSIEARRRHQALYCNHYPRCKECAVFLMINKKYE